MKKKILFALIEVVITIGVIVGAITNIPIVIHDPWWQGFALACLVFLFGDILKWIAPFETDEQEEHDGEDWSSEPPEIVAAAKAICAMPKDEAPCIPCMIQTKRVLAAYQATQNPEVKT